MIDSELIHNNVVLIFFQSEEGLCCILMVHQNPLQMFVVPVVKSVTCICT